MTDRKIETVQGLYEAFGRGDIDYILDQVADDVDWGPAGQRYRALARHPPGPGQGVRLLQGAGGHPADHRVHAAVVHVERNRRHGRDTLGRDRPGHREVHRDGHPSLVALPRRQDLLLPRHRGHRADQALLATG